MGQHSNLSICLSFVEFLPLAERRTIAPTGCWEEGVMTRAVNSFGIHIEVLRKFLECHAELIKVTLELFPRELTLELPECSYFVLLVQTIEKYKSQDFTDNTSFALHCGNE